MPFLSDYSESFDGYYESPVKLILGEIRNQLDGEIYKAIQRVGVDVNKEELIKALAYDRGQYAKGYADAMKNAIPLDKLCEWLSSHAYKKTGYYITDPGEARYAHEWEHDIRKWMEGQNE